MNTGTPSFYRLDSPSSDDLKTIRYEAYKKANKHKFAKSAKMFVKLFERNGCHLEDSILFNDVVNRCFFEPGFPEGFSGRELDVFFRVNKYIISTKSLKNEFPNVATKRVFWDLRNKQINNLNLNVKLMLCSKNDTTSYFQWFPNDIIYLIARECTPILTDLQAINPRNL